MNKDIYGIIFVMIRTVFTVVFLVFFSSVASHATEPIRIGLSLGLTGKYSEMSDMKMKAFRIWERDINSRGGMLGRNIQLIVYDDKSDPQTAKELYERLILTDKVDLVFGPYSSEITEAVLPVTEKYGHPVLAHGASADRLWQKGYKHVFGIVTPASRYAVSFLEMLVNNNIDDIAIFHADDAFSKDIADGTKKWAERFGLRVVLMEGFKKGTRNLDDFAKKVRSSSARVLIMCGHLDESIDMRLSLKNIKWHPKVYFASVGPATQRYYDSLKSDADFTFSSSQWEHHGGLNIAGCSEFYEAFIKTYKNVPSYHAAAAYAAGEILEAAIKKAESLDRNKVMDILSVMDTMSIIGRYGVDKTRVQVKHFNLIIQWQNGKKEIVWPEGLRTAKPMFR